jgi:hypothetical protein
MTHTATHTLEELALARLCDRKPVTIQETGVQGVVDAIYVSADNPEQRRVRVTERNGRVHNLDLKVGALGWYA